MPDRLNSVVIRVPTPDGTMFLMIDEDESGKPVMIRLEIGKVGSALRAWTDVTGRLITLAIANGATLEDIVTEISNITSDRLVYNRRIPIRSGPDGIAYGIMQYKGLKYDEMNKILGGDGIDRRRRSAKIHGG